LEGPYDDIVKKYVDAHGRVAAIEIAVELGVPLAEVAKSLKALAEKGHLRIESTAKIPGLKVPPAPTFGKQYSVFSGRHRHPLQTCSEEFSVRKMERTPRQQAYMKNVRELRKIKEEFLKAMNEEEAIEGGDNLMVVEGEEDLLTRMSSDPLECNLLYETEMTKA